MAVTAEARGPIHPLFAFLLSASVPLFLGGLLSDLGYGKVPDPQWANMAAWLIAGAMVFTGFAALWALIASIVGRRGRRARLLCFGLLVATFILGLIDSFVHARDAYGMMPAGPILSLITFLLAALAAAVGLSALLVRDVK